MIPASYTAAKLGHSVNARFMLHPPPHQLQPRMFGTTYIATLQPFCLYRYFKCLTPTDSLDKMPPSCPRATKATQLYTGHVSCNDGGAFPHIWGRGDIWDLACL